MSLGEFNGVVCELLEITGSDTEVSLADFLSRFHCVEFSSEDPLKEFMYEPPASAAGSDDDSKEEDA